MQARRLRSQSGSVLPSIHARSVQQPRQWAHPTHISTSSTTSSTHAQNVLRPSSRNWDWQDSHPAKTCTERSRQNCSCQRPRYHHIGCQLIKCATFVAHRSRRKAHHLVRNWEHELSIPQLLSVEPSPPPTTLEFVRSGLHGRVTGYAEANRFPAFSHCPYAERHQNRYPLHAWSLA